MKTDLDDIVSNETNEYWSVLLVVYLNEFERLWLF